MKEFSDIFKGLWTFGEEYKIQVKDDAKPYCLYTPRRIPFALRKQVKEEHQRMESLGVISPVSTPTTWCSGMVVMQVLMSFSILQVVLDFHRTMGKWNALLRQWRQWCPNQRICIWLYLATDQHLYRGAAFHQQNSAWEEKSGPLFHNQTSYYFLNGHTYRNFDRKIKFSNRNKWITITRGTVFKITHPYQSLLRFGSH